MKKQLFRKIRYKLLSRKIEYSLNTPYYNPYKVGFFGDFDTYYSVACSWPGFEEQEDMSVQLICEGKNIKDFVRTFNIKWFADIDKIKPDDLLRIYQEEKAFVSVSKNDDRFCLTLDFKKEGNRIFADNIDEVHEVFESLKTPEDFVSYSKMYFLTH